MAIIGEFQIIFDDGEPILVNERKQPNIAQNNKAVLLYSSGQLESKLHKIKVVRTSYELSLVNLLCITEM